MTRAVILTALIAMPAMAQDIHRWNADTYIVMQPTTQAGAFAEVIFSNHDIHVFFIETFTLTHDGITVDVMVEINASGADDRMTVTPPPGFIAVPPELLVPENGAGRILIMEDATS